MNLKDLLAPVALTLGLTCGGCVTKPATQPAFEPVIVKGSNVAELVRAVESVGGTVTHELGIISAVGADLTAGQLEMLQENHHISQTFTGGYVTTAGGNAGGAPGPYVNYPSLVGADQLHAEGITGESVTVAIVDSGMAAIAELQKDTTGTGRMQNRYNAIKDKEGPHLDKYGHGTHVASIIWNTDYSDDGTMRRNSLAPDVKAISVKAFGGQGTGTYADVIRGLDWILERKDDYNIRVVNLSFSAEPRSHYWEDPINQAVMRLWQAGIVVVASAGNAGRDIGIEVFLLND